MNKITIFFIGATVMVVGLLAALLGYEYAMKQGEEIETPDVQEEMEENTESVVSEKPSVTEETSLIVDRAQPVETEEIERPLASINVEKAEEAGFQDARVLLSAFNGLIFNEIDLREFRDDDHITYELLEGDEHAGTITELILPEEEITNELYGSIKNKILGNENFEINETGQYGEMSFFANHKEDTNSVFLVVKFGKRLYTFHYPAKNHNKIKNLINLL